jgi:GMP synthase-like glutamine amidotransferase
MPFMGICLGHQLLAYAYGAEVGPSDKSEVGVMPVRKTEHGDRSTFFRDLPDMMDTLQWHSAEVKTIPAGFQVLAESDLCAIQSLSYGDRVFSVQYHQEITETTVSDWSKISEYKISLEKSLGENAVEKLQKDVLVNINNFNHAAELLYRNWKSTVFDN